MASSSALGALWREPRLEVDEPRRALRLPVWSEPACGALGIATFALLVYAGLQGSPVPGRNLAPTFVYVVFWVGLVPLTVLLGDVFSLGHVGGLVLAHDRALAVYRGGRRATRSQYWMLTVMVGFTSLGLFLLASIKR